MPTLVLKGDSTGLSSWRVMERTRVEILPVSSNYRHHHTTTTTTSTKQVLPREGEEWPREGRMEGMDKGTQRFRPIPNTKGFFGP